MGSVNRDLHMGSVNRELTYVFFNIWLFVIIDILQV